MKYNLLFVFINLLLQSKAYSQACIPEWTQPGSGIFPDTITNMPDGVVDVPYDITVQFKVPLKDSSIISTGIDVNRVELTGVEGLLTIPSSVPFHYNCNPSNCTFKADSVGCVRIQGTATATGVYPLVITAKVYITPTLFLPVNFTGYEIEIGNTIAAPLQQSATFSVSHIAPNPAGNVANIAISLSNSGIIEIMLYNVIGNQVYSNVLDGRAGLNSVSIDVSKFQPGIYFYTVRDAANAVTGRMIVNR